MAVPAASFQAGGPPVPTRPPQGRRRWGLMVLGIAVAAVGLVALIGGAVAGAIDQTRSSADPIAESRTPQPLVFDAENETYLVSISGERFGADVSIVSNTRCTIEQSDGSTAELNGAVQAIGETTGNIAKVGSFEGFPGETTVTCVSSRQDVRFFVDDEGDLHRYGTIALLVGAVIALAGTGLILVGVFTRKPARP
jgi:hypothetical protein